MDLIPCEALTPSEEQMRFAASIALGTDDRYQATYNAFLQRVELLALRGDYLPRSLFLARKRYELTQQHEVTSAALCLVDPLRWQQATLVALAEIQASSECDHGEPYAGGRYEITTPGGSTRTENLNVAQTVCDALREVGARPRLRDLRDPRDGIDRIEGKRVIVEVDGCKVPVSGVERV